MRCISNMENADKPFVLQAIAETGALVEWHDTPDERMPANECAYHGSVWSAEKDCRS